MTKLKKLCIAALCVALSAFAAFALLAVGIRSAQQQDALFFAVRDIKRLVIPEQPSAADSAKSTTRIAGRIAFVLPASRPVAKGPKPWIWYMPTLPELPGAEEQEMFKAFSEAGIAVAGIDAGETYGSPQGNAVFDAFYREMTQARGFAARPVLLARSRGGLMALSWAEKNPAKVAAIAGIYPVSNLASYPGIAKASGAFNMTPEALANALPGINPVDNLAALARAKVPLYILHGDADEIVPIEDNSRMLHYRYAALGGPVSLTIVRGEGHNLSDGFFHSALLTRFVIDRALSQ